MARTAADVEADILTTRCALIAADAEAEKHDSEPEQWTQSDDLFQQLADLCAEFARLPHQRLPSDTDGHTAPKSY